MRETSLVGKILIVVCGLAIVTFSIMSTIIYIYTIYYYAVNNGFWGTVYAIFLPIISSITLFFELIGTEGFINNFTIMLLIWIFSGAIFTVPIFFKSNT